MAFSDHKITSGDVAAYGVIAAPDKLTGSAAENKRVFDRLIREAVAELFNGLIDELEGASGAAGVGASAIDGVTGGDVQTVLGSLKTLLDAKSASADVNAALALKSDKAATDLHFKSVSLNAQTGVFTFTREDGSCVSVDTVLEKVATNWQYDAATQSLVLTLADGTTQRVPLSAFITETEFRDSAQLAFSASDHQVTATVKAGSITDTMLSSALVSQLQGYVGAAAASATDAAQSAAAAEGYRDAAASSAGRAATSASGAAASEANAAASETAAGASAAAAAGSESAASGYAAAAGVDAGNAEAWAVGQRGGQDVPSTDGTYHNNAKYWAEQAQQAAGGGVISFNGRSGSVEPQSGDYTAAMVGADPAGTASAVQANLTAHANNTTIHITAEERTAWNAKVTVASVTIPRGRMRGDVNGDGLITAFDKALVERMYADFDPKPASGTEDFYAADVDGDGKIFPSDASLIGQMDAGVTKIGRYSEVTGNWTNNPNYLTDEAQFYTDISVTGITAGDSVLVVTDYKMIAGAEEIFDRVEAGNGYIRVYAKMCPITNVPAIVFWKTDTGGAAIIAQGVKGLQDVVNDYALQQYNITLATRNWMYDDNDEKYFQHVILPAKVRFGSKAQATLGFANATQETKYNNAGITMTDKGNGAFTFEAVSVPSEEIKCRIFIQLKTFTSVSGESGGY